MIVDVVAGARPNYVKVAALYHAWKDHPAASAAIRFRLIETGQHTDDRLSQAFARQLGLPAAYRHLHAATGSTPLLTASILEHFSRHLQADPPDWVVVVGDVTSTLACGLAAKQCAIRLAHVEAGLRSGDESMPEELNRRVTDALADLLFTTSETAGANLLAEGIAAAKIYPAGNTMIDTLMRFQNRLPAPPLPQTVEGPYFLLTLHRPSNVDAREAFEALIWLVCEVLAPFPVVLPVHPRTAAALGNFAIPPNLHLIPPQPYLAFLALLRHCRGVLTDSGGVSEEATFLRKPCLILRNTTERPETVQSGRSALERDNAPRLRQLLQALKTDEPCAGPLPPLWDGRAGTRIWQYLLQYANENRNF